MTILILHILIFLTAVVVVVDDHIVGGDDVVVRHIILVLRSRLGPTLVVRFGLLVSFTLELVIHLLLCARLVSNMWLSLQSCSESSRHSRLAFVLLPRISALLAASLASECTLAGSNSALITLHLDLLLASRLGHTHLESH